MNSTDTDRPNAGERSLIAELRAVAPNRLLSLPEALTVAALQADRLLLRRQCTDAPISVDIVADLPKIVVESDPDLPSHLASGSSHWDNARRCWVISINPQEPRTRQRFTVLHEFKHIIDHYHPGLGGPLPRTIRGLEPVEYLADYFAGCVLMPKHLVRSAYFADLIQRTRDLAYLFDVSPRAITVRLDQLGLTDSNAPLANRTAHGRTIDRRSQPYFRATAFNAVSLPKTEVSA